jgi:DNA-directed RNA polymerase subunit RPC12/RpoP
VRLLFTSSGNTKVVRGGQSFVDDCPECGHRATFDEVEITESYGVFWIDVVSDTTRAFRCCRCGDTFDLKDASAAASPAPAAVAKPAPVAKPAAPAKSAKEIARERDAKATQIEDELAELKRRMGR